MLRIIAGKYRGKKLLSLEGEDVTRPTRSRLREAMFSSLGNIEGASFLDLFAGSGACGIEALSRGVNDLTLVDKDSGALKIIRANLASIDENYELIGKDALSFLKECKKSYDICFLDPPYHFKDKEEVFKLIRENNILKKDGLLLYEEDAKEEPFIPLGYELIKDKKYGISRLFYYRRKDE